MKPVSGRKPRKRGNGAATVVDPEAFLAATEGTRSEQRVKAGEVVFGQGDPADAIFHIRTGRIQLTVVSDQGKEGVIALFGPGGLLWRGMPCRSAGAPGLGERNRSVGGYPDREGCDGSAAP